MTVVHPCTHPFTFLLILLAPLSFFLFFVLFRFVFCLLCLTSLFFMLSFSIPLRKENLSESCTWFPFPGRFAFSAEMRRHSVVNGTVKDKREKEGREVEYLRRLLKSCKCPEILPLRQQLKGKTGLKL